MSCTVFNCQLLDPCAQVIEPTNHWRGAHQDIADGQPLEGGRQGYGGSEGGRKGGRKHKDTGWRHTLKSKNLHL
jgi:hypothetical protein